MTSSSDTEFSKRRIYIDGLPIKSSSTEVRALFSPFGAVTYVHLARAGHGFVTFEDEEAAFKALNLHGSEYKQCRLIVQPETEAAMPFPIVAAKREIHFPKAQIGSRQLPSSSSSSSHSRNIISNPNVSSNSRQQRTGGRGQRLERRSSHPNIVKIIKSEASEIDVAKFESEMTFKDGFPERYQRLFSYTSFPHVARTIFMALDTISLVRCRHVCKDWSYNIDQYIINSPILRPILLERWHNANCSIYPLTPEGNELLERKDSGAETKYRNVLSFKADENEIILAVDNGNVEIYDRATRKLTCVLVGTYSSSPVKVDFNANLIFVQYTCAFAATSRRRQSPSSWWNVVDRKSKRLLRSIDRDNTGTPVDLRLHFDNMLYWTTNNVIYAIDVVGSSRLQMSPVLNLNGPEQRIEAVDFDTKISVAILHQSTKLKVLLFNLKESFGLQKEPAPNSAESKNTNNQEISFELLTKTPDVPDFDEKKCTCLSVQIRHPICMTILSNSRGSFEYIGEKPYVLIVFTNLVTQECIRILKLDSNWMHQMSEILVPYDNESCMLTAKFSKDFLAVGFGSFSDRKDGAIAMWKMPEILSNCKTEDDLTFWTIPAPIYHWESWDGHTGGVNCLHIDSFGMIASNACIHQVNTRCIERCDESKKDNVLIYDFWQPGEDARREQFETVTP